MTRLRRLNLPQRVLLVVALAGLLVLVAQYIVTKGLSGPDGGWVAYASDTAVTFSGDHRVSPLTEWLVWLGALIVWTAASLWLLANDDEQQVDRAD